MLLRKCHYYYDDVINAVDKGKDDHTPDEFKSNNKDNEIDFCKEKNLKFI